MILDFIFFAARLPVDDVGSPILSLSTARSWVGRRSLQVRCPGRPDGIANTGGSRHCCRRRRVAAGGRPGRGVVRPEAAQGAA